MKILPFLPIFAANEAQKEAEQQLKVALTNAIGGVMHVLNSYKNIILVSTIFLLLIIALFRTITAPPDERSRVLMFWQEIQKLTIYFVIVGMCYGILWVTASVLHF